jgi:glycosyltransferase involved in cell wall biosynthesis
MSKTNICYVADGVSLNSNVADIVHVREVVNGLTCKGFNVSLIIRGRKNKTNQLFAQEISHIPDLHFPFSLLAYIASFVLLLASAIKKPAVFYVRDTGTNIAILLGKVFAIPTILEINGDLENEYSNMPQLFFCFTKLLINLTYRSADYVIVPSQKLVKRISAKKPLDRIFHIPNGVNPRQFHPISKLECRKRLKMQECTYFCFVGHLASWQGVENSITAFSKLVESRPDFNFKYLIVGTGPYLGALRKLANELRLNERVQFLGAVPHEQVPYIIGATDICVAPFKSHRNEKIGISPLKIYEYLSCGRPVITSNLPGLEIVSQLNAGLLIPPDNIDELFFAYEKVLNNLPYFAREALYASKAIAREHSWNSRVIEITNIIKSVM